MTKTTHAVAVVMRMSEDLTVILSGSRSAISMSKIRKISVIRKNRSEKGLRAFLKGEKPHSNGVFFSIFSVVFSLVNSEAIKKIIANSSLRVVRIIRVNITNLINK